MSADPKEDLRAKVQAAVEEYDSVVAYHETWRFASRDKPLHERVSHSFAGRTFLVVRSALRREMLLALSRLWDTRTEAIKMSSIADELGKPAIVDSLWPNSAVYAGPRQMAAEAVNLIRKYEKGGPSYATLKRLRKLRNQHLAHRQINRAPIGTVEEDILEKEIDALYEDSARLISLLEHVVEKTAYNPKDTAGVYTFYAQFFWEAVRGERTAGHPRHAGTP
jgi:hypothetical protein